MTAKGCRLTSIWFVTHVYSKANRNISHRSTCGTGTITVTRRCRKLGTFPKGTVVFSCVVFGKDEENVEGRVSSNINKQQFSTSSVCFSILPSSTRWDHRFNKDRWPWCLKRQNSFWRYRQSLVFLRRIWNCFIRSQLCYTFTLQVNAC